MFTVRTWTQAALFPLRESMPPPQDCAAVPVRTVTIPQIWAADTGRANGAANRHPEQGLAQGWALGAKRPRSTRRPSASAPRQMPQECKRQRQQDQGPGAGRRNSDTADRGTARIDDATVDRDVVVAGLTVHQVKSRRRHCRRTDRRGAKQCPELVHDWNDPSWASVSVIVLPPSGAVTEPPAFKLRVVEALAGSAIVTAAGRESVKDSPVMGRPARW